MLYVIALGGNALSQRGEPLEAALMKKNAFAAAKSIASIAQKHHVVIVHGNGPQVGLLALQNAAYTTVTPYPFDILGAESQGMIGYLLQQGISHYLKTKTIATVLTQVIVDAKDPAFKNPTKFIGPVYSSEEVAVIQAEHPDWTIKADGKYFRRVVPSPHPQSVQELPIIQTLLANNHIVIAGGGGGVPCIEDSKGIMGVEAVIDKDMTGSLLARELNADQFIILTDVDGVYADWGTEQQRLLPSLSVAEASQKEYAAGSMGPKIKACIEFAKTTHRSASIGRLDQLNEITEGTAGTVIKN